MNIQINFTKNIFKIYLCGNVKIFCKNFVKVTFLLKSYMYCKLISRYFISGGFPTLPHCVLALPQFCSKISWSRILLKLWLCFKSIWRKNFEWQFSSSTLYCMYTMWKLLRFSLTHFWQKFRESNVFTKGLIWRIIFWWDLIFHFFTLCCMENGNCEFFLSSHFNILEKKFREINSYFSLFLRFLRAQFREMFSSERKFF